MDGTYILGYISPRYLRPRTNITRLILLIKAAKIKTYDAALTGHAWRFLIVLPSNEIDGPVEKAS
jgi:hypothetical protein